MLLKWVITGRSRILRTCIKVNRTERLYVTSYVHTWICGIFKKSFNLLYRCNHSTESALLRIKHDFHKSFDSKSGTVLVLLDLKSAFDTVDHAIMLHVEGLHWVSNYAISGLVLQWFRSYLADRHFSVCVRIETSDKCPLKYGVPQGSVLGPLLEQTPVVYPLHKTPWWYY